MDRALLARSRLQYWWVGYFFGRAARECEDLVFVLLWTTFGLALYPALTAVTQPGLSNRYLCWSGWYISGRSGSGIIRRIDEESSAEYSASSYPWRRVCCIFQPSLHHCWELGWPARSIKRALLVSAGVRFLGLVCSVGGKCASRLAPRSTSHRPE